MPEIKRVTCVNGKWKNRCRKWNRDLVSPENLPVAGKSYNVIAEQNQYVGTDRTGKSAFEVFYHLQGYPWCVSFRANHFTDNNHAL